jgi:hypothetical protein
MITFETLLSAVEYGIPSSKYDGSSLDFAGDAVQGPGYYAGRSGQQTFTLRLTGFTGQITIQGTLDSDPDQARWFSIYEIGNDGSTGDSSTITTHFSVDRVGQFVWLRVRVEFFSDGTIDSISVDYP